MDEFHQEECSYNWNPQTNNIIGLMIDARCSKGKKHDSRTYRNAELTEHMMGIVAMRCELFCSSLTNGLGHRNEGDNAGEQET